MSQPPEPLDESALRDLFMRCGDPVLLVAFDGGVRWANPALQLLLGLPFAALCGRTFSEFLHGEDQAGLVAALRASRRGAAPSRIVVLGRVRDARGAWLHVEWSVTASEPLQCHHLLGREVDLRLPAPGDDPAAAPPLRHIGEDAREAFWVVSPDKSEQVFVSPSYEQIWGRSRDSLYADPHSSLQAVHPEDAALLRRAIEIQSRGEPVSGEYRILRPDGTVRWIRARSVPVRDAHGRLFRTVGISEDITARRAVEAELRRQQELVRTITNHTSDGVFVKDIEGRYAMMNPAGAALVGRTSEETLGRDDWALFAGESAARIARNDRRVLQGEDTQTFEVALTAAGRTRDYVATKSKFRDAEGRTIGVLGVCRDRSHGRDTEALRRVLDDESRRRRRALEALDVERASLSRELHDGFGQILAGLQLHLLSKHGRSSDLREEIQLVQRATSGLSALSRALHPLHLEAGSLFAAVVERFGAEDATTESRVLCSQTGSEPPLSVRWKEQAFHAVLAAVECARRAGGASEIHVRFDWRRSTLDLVIAADGLPLAADAAATTPLHELSDRVASLGGTARWSDVAEPGVRIAMQIPTAPPQPGSTPPESLDR